MLGALGVVVACAAVVAVSTAGMLRGVEPCATWYYPLAWYPTLLAADAVVRLRTGRWALAGRPRAALAALGWSVPFWLFFELVNFRVANWYYVFVPRALATRWIGIALSFATVLPAILLAREALRAFGVAEGARWRPVRSPVRPVALQAAGLSFFALSFVWPRLFFPLVWGGVTLLVDPWVHRRDAERSFLGMLERGRPATVLQVLLGGLAIGFLWELLNARARGHWIYTVPGLEDVKLFEMPVPGFLGFPVLALDGWTTWNALVLLGLAPDVSTSGNRPRAAAPIARVVAACAVAVPACLAVLRGMDRWTVTSVTPELDAVAPEGAAPLAASGMDVFALASSRPERVARLASAEPDEAAAWIRRARLVALRGIGVQNARFLEEVGVTSVERLADADADALASALRRVGAPDVREARVRVWVRGARDALSAEATPSPTTSRAGTPLLYSLIAVTSCRSASRSSTRASPNPAASSQPTTSSSP